MCYFTIEVHSDSCSEFASKMESRAGGPAASGSGRAKKPLNRSLSNSDVAGYEKNDGSMSDSAVTSSLTEGRKRRPSLGYKVAALVGLSRRSSSTSQLSATGEDPNDASYYANYDPSQPDQPYHNSHAGYDQSQHAYDNRGQEVYHDQRGYDNRDYADGGRYQDRGYEYDARYDSKTANNQRSRYEDNNGRGREYDRESYDGYTNDQRSRSTNRGYDDRYDKGREYERRSRSHDRAYDVERAYERRRDRYQRSRSQDQEDSYDRGYEYDRGYDYDRGSAYDKSGREYDKRGREYERGHEAADRGHHDPRSYPRGYDQRRSSADHGHGQVAGHGHGHGHGHDPAHQGKPTAATTQQHQLQQQQQQQHQQQQAPQQQQQHQQQQQQQQQVQPQSTHSSEQPQEEPQVLISQTKHSKLANKLAQQYGLTISADVQQQYNQVIKSFHAKQDEKLQQQQQAQYDEVVRTAIEHQKAGQMAIAAIAEADPPSAATSAINQISSTITQVAGPAGAQAEAPPIAQVQAAATGLLSSFKSAIFK